MDHFLEMVRMLLIALLFLLVLIFVAIIIPGDFIFRNQESKECEARGGYYVHKFSVCLKKEDVIDLREGDSK